MKILLTGALGFIGKNFLLHRPKNWQIFALDLVEDKNFQKLIPNTNFFKIDLSDKTKVRQLAEGLPHFDVCIHLAANGDPALSVVDPFADLQATGQTLINVGTNFAISKLIYVSSGAVYDGNAGLVTVKTVVRPQLPYSISHLAAEDYVRFFAKSGQIKNYVILRFFGAYGPYEPPRKIYTKLVQSLAIKKEKTFMTHGDGQNLIDAMYIDDGIQGLGKVILSKKANLTVDFCKGDHLTINALVEEAAKIFDCNVKIKHEGVVPEYIEFHASGKKFNQMFNFEPQVSLKEGLKKLYQFYEKQ